MPFDPISLGLAGAGLGAGLFGRKQKNPADAAMPYLNQIPGATLPYYNPYIQAGQGALGDLQSQISQLLGNPGELYSQLGQNYQQSPGYKFALDQAMQAGGNAAAAGGMLGTPANQQNQMSMANNLASQDFGNYMQNILGLYGSGLQGLGGLNQMGYGAATDYASGLANTLGQQAQYAYGGQAGKNAGRSAMGQNIFGGLGALLGAWNK